MECQFRVHPLELLIIVDCCTHFNTRIINIVLDCGDERISNLQFKKNINFCDFFFLLQNTEAIYIICLLIILLLLIPSIFFKKQNYPPSPLALPIIGHLHLLTHAPHQALANLSSRHGPLILIRLGSVPFLVASSPDIAKNLLKTNDDSFCDRPQKAVVDYLTYGSQDVLFAPHGPYWKFMKGLCVSRLLGGTTLDLLQPVRRDELRQLLQFLRGKAHSGESVDVGAAFAAMSNHVISRMMMSRRTSFCGGENAMVREIAELLGGFDLSDCIWLCKNMDLQGFRRRSRDVRDRFDEAMETMIDEHQRQTREVKDLLDILIDVAEDEDSEVKLTRENIKAIILDLFTAVNSTAVTMEWALAELIKNPNILQNAAEEIKRAVGSSRVVDESDISSLPYLEAVVKETLRLHPPAPLIYRQSRKQCSVAGYPVPANTGVMVNVWAIGRDPRQWPNALEFRPERFLREGGKGQVDFHSLPFGSGRRACPGVSLGLKMVHTTLGAMVQCFEWRVEGGVVDMEEGRGLILPRAHPLICFPAPTLNPFPSA